MMLGCFNKKKEIDLPAKIREIQWALEAQERGAGLSTQYFLVKIEALEKEVKKLKKKNNTPSAKGSK